MKRLVLCVAFFVGWVQVEEAAPNPRIVIHGDLAPPAVPEAFADASSLGIGGGIGFSVDVMPRLTLLAGVDYTTFGFDDDEFRDTSGLPAGTRLVGGETSTLFASVGLRIDLMYVPGTALRAYVTGGGGYLRIDSDDVVSDGMVFKLRNEDTAAVQAGGGFQVAFGPSLSVFFDALFVMGFTDTDVTGYVPLRVGVSFDMRPGM